MDCAEVLFSGHAIRRMFERGFSKNDILTVLREGEVIAEYPSDKPHPSCLLLGLTADRSLHVVVARELRTRRCFVVMVYLPDPGVWSDDFRTRR